MIQRICYACSIAMLAASQPLVVCAQGPTVSSSAEAVLDALSDSPQIPLDVQSPYRPGAQPRLTPLRPADNTITDEDMQLLPALPDTSSDANAAQSDESAADDSSNDDASAAEQSLFGNSPEDVSSDEQTTADPSPAVPSRTPATAPFQDQVVGDFPALPPDPDELRYATMPSLNAELWQHGGSYLYVPEGDRLNWPHEGEAHYDLLRVPETYHNKQPVTGHTPFLGVGPVNVKEGQHWRGGQSYWWEPRFVAYGSYSLLGLFLEQNRQQQNAIGHQLLIDLDYRLTGTERLHVQFRPLGKRGTGGSAYNFNKPTGYIDNSTAEPDRYWVEAELHSLLGYGQDPNARFDYHIVAGKFPFALHNFLLMNDDILGAAINKNTLFIGPFSNVNVQAFVGVNDVDAYVGDENQVYGLHTSIDHLKTFYEITYAYLASEQDRGTHYLGLSRTKHFGQMTVAGRGFAKLGDRGGSGSSHLVTLEMNYAMAFEHHPIDIQHGVYFCNMFYAGNNWNPIAGGNFNRLRTAFEVNPLVRLSATPAGAETFGISGGAQFFRHHDDESFIPELAFESIDGEPVFGIGIRYLRKTTDRSFFELLGVSNHSGDSRYDRAGVFLSQTFIF